MIKFVTELPGNNAEIREDETVKIRFENFDGPTWSKLIDYVDSFTKEEPEMKRFKSEIVETSNKNIDDSFLACENAEVNPV